MFHLARIHFQTAATGFFGRQSGKIGFVDVAGLVNAVETGRIERADAGIQLFHHTFQIVEVLEHDTVCADFGGDFFRAAAVGNQFLTGRHVDAVHVRITDFGGSRSDVYFSGARRAYHFNDFAAGRAAHDGIVYQQHAFSLKLGFHRAEFLAHGFSTRRLAGHDEGAAYIAVFNQAFAIRFVQMHRQFHRTRAAGIGNRHHDVDVAHRQLAPDFFCQRHAHVHTRLIYRHAVDNGVGAGEINIFEQTRTERVPVAALS